MSIDRRQFKRFETLLIVEIGSQKESESYFFGITKNVSFEGFIFESQNYDLRPGDILEFRLKHPQSKLSVPVLGKIVWNRETKFECYSGVRFHRFDDETKSKVFELISADKIGHSGHVPSCEDDRSPEQQNERTESGNTDRDGILSDSIGNTAYHDNSSQTGQSDIHNRADLPVNVENHKNDMNYESASGEVPGDTVNVSDLTPETRKADEKLIQKNVSRAANGSRAARRKDHKRRGPYSSVAAAVITLFIAAGLIIFMSDDIREKIIHQELNSKVINNTDTSSHDGRIPELNETGVSKRPPVLIDQSESLPDDDNQTAGDKILTETGKPLDQNGYEKSADHDYGGTAEQLTTLQMADQIVVAQDKKVLLQESERKSYPAVVSVEDESARGKNQGSPDHSVFKDSGDKKINKASVEGSVRKKEAVQKIVEKIRATVKEKSKPVSQSAKGKSAEKSTAPEAQKSLLQSPVQKISKSVSNKINTKVKKISKPENNESVSQKKIPIQISGRVSEDPPKQLKAASTQDKEKEKMIEIAKNVTGDKEKKRVQAVESVKKSKAGVENDQVIQKVSTPVRQTPTATSIVKKNVPRIETGESDVIKKKSERKVPLNRGEPKMQKVEKVPKQEPSKEPADMNRRPKVALVLKQNQSKPADVKNKQSELTDEYLNKYYTSYADFFDDNSNNWDIFDIGAASARIEEGLYHIENKKEGGALIVLHYLPFPHSPDFVLEVGIIEIKAGANSYGVIFGAKDARNNYSFQIRENKFYSVKNYLKGVAEYVTTGQIKGSLKDNKSAALLKIVKQATVIKFYVNNRYVDKVTNLEFYGNQIGFIVEGKSHIAIDSTRSYIRKAGNEHTN